MKRQTTESGCELRKRQNVLWDWPVEWESIQYKGKRVRDGFCAKLPHSFPDTYHWSFELSKCSLKYEPSVFNINTNVKDGIMSNLVRTHPTRFDTFSKVSNRVSQPLTRFDTLSNNVDV